MNFKGYVAKDLDIFINPDEFAEWHELDGKPTLVVVEENSFDEFSSTTELENIMQGIFRGAITIFVKSSDFNKPDVGDRIRFDDNYYFVVGVSEEAGVLKIDLASYES